jgi:photosystem II stability/assembly factor-like uncharacterized protein
MRGDFSRVTFHPQNHYSGVRLQQGRVQLDAEFNEHVDIDAHRDAETTLDLVGPAGAPFDGGGFLIGVGTAARDVDVEGSTGWAVGEDALLLQLVSDQWVLVTPPDGTGDLHALQLTGPSAGWAVGDNAVILGLAPPSSGAPPSWSAHNAPAGVIASLYGVAAVGAEAWAVGERGTILYHADGTWVAQSPPDGATATLRGVHFSDADHGWAVGDGGTILATVDGTTWQRQQAPPGTGTLRAVFARDADHVWAVGDGGRIISWNPATKVWASQTSGSTAELRAVCFQDAVGIVIGGDGTVLVTGDDGALWTPEALPAEQRPSLHGLDIDAGTAFAIGDGASLARKPNETFVAGPALPAAATGRSLTISAGDMYVEGVRVVNERPVSLTGQPDLAFLRPPETERTPVFPPPQGEGTYGVYLEVFEEHVTALQREELREVALGGPDTATRTRTVWQAKLLKLDGDPSCTLLEAGLPPGPVIDVRMRARAKPSEVAPDECSLAAGGGFRRLENQLYRVEIHHASDAKNGPTFTWSRDNAMVVARLEALDIKLPTTTTPGSGSVTVSDLGRDEVLGFGPGQVIELNDETRALRGEPGELLQVKGTRGNVLDIDPVLLPDRALTMADFPVRPTVRRWDGHQAPKTQGWNVLDEGVEVQFAGTRFRTGDHWVFPARSLKGTVEWPNSGGQPLFQEPNGPRRRFAPLGLVKLGKDGMWSDPTDCRRLFPPLTGLVDFRYVGGDGQEATPSFIAAANPFATLARPLQVGVANGRWPVTKAPVKFEVVDGGGRLNGASSTVTAFTDTSGIAECTWDLRMDPSPPPPLRSQQVKATLLDDHGREMQTPIIFNANLSIADEVAYDGRGCATLNDQTTVQTAIQTLSRLTRLYAISGTGIDLDPALSGEPLTVEVVVVNDCGPVANAVVEFKPAANSGGVTPLTNSTNNQGRTSTQWTPDPHTATQGMTATLLDPGTGNLKNHPGQVTFIANRILADRVAYDPAACAKVAGATTVQQAINRLCQDDPAIHVASVELMGGDKLRNDMDVPVERLADGLRLTCDRSVHPKSVAGKPVCIVTLDLPFPFNQADTDLWGPPVIGSVPLTLAATLDTKDNDLLWFPEKAAAAWLRAQLFEQMSRLGRGERVLAHLTVKGNFVWASADDSHHLDGDVFGFNDGTSTSTEIRLPSGDGRAGGDLEMWFWLRKPPAIVDLILEPSEVIGGRRVRGTVRLAGPAPAGFSIVLSSSEAVAVPQPSVLQVPPGASAAQFTVLTRLVPVVTVVNITASTQSSSATSSLVVRSPFS